MIIDEYSIMPEVIQDLIEGDQCCKDHLAIFPFLIDMDP